MKTVFNIVLGLCALALIYICYSSIMGPINFEKAKKQRDQAVIARLIDIRKAQTVSYTHLIGVCRISCQHGDGG